LEAADARGAIITWVGGTNLTNFIWPDGHIDGITLTGTKRLVVRDHDGNPNLSPPGQPIPIKLQNGFAADSGGALQFVFDEDAWGSTISFAAGMPVALAGTLELTYASGSNLSLQIGRTLDLFDWTGVNPSNEFSIQSSYVWDTSKLYTTGEVTFLAAAGLPGDFNGDNSVDAADYVVWRKGVGTTYTQAAIDVWRSHFGQPAGAGEESENSSVPEPATVHFILVAVCLCSRQLRQQRRGHKRALLSPRAAVHGVFIVPKTNSNPTPQKR
jgi:hypothetical protein